MKLPEGVVLLDSLGDLESDNKNSILVCGSHCGGNSDLARQVKNCHVKAVFLNNAGVGKNQAGIRGLVNYEAEHILACAVDHNSAEIGVSRDTWDSGVISHINALAQAFGIKIGDSVKETVDKLVNSKMYALPAPDDMNSEYAANNNSMDYSNKAELKKQKQIQIDDVKITVTNSITFLNGGSAGDVVVCGSHGGASAGHYAQKHGVNAVFFNDAGIGKNNAGVKSLEYLNDSGILACTVDCMSAEIFNGQDVLDNGIITVCNQLAKNRNIREKMTVKEAVKLINQTC